LLIIKDRDTDLLNTRGPTFERVVSTRVHYLFCCKQSLCPWAWLGTDETYYDELELEVALLIILQHDEQCHPDM
jgi:hypothetical protein